MQGAGLVMRQRAHTGRLVEVALTVPGEASRAHATRIHCDMRDLLGLTTPSSARCTTLRLLASRTELGPVAADHGPSAVCAHHLQ